MLDLLFQISQEFIRMNTREYHRYFIRDVPLKSRLSILVGARGIGKTTLLVQYILKAYQNDPFTRKALYIQADHVSMATQSLYNIAEEFALIGGEILCVDEIHKYKDWAKETKSIYDTLPRLKMIASGSSALEIIKASHDLSRRAIIYRLPGLSFREFSEISSGEKLESIPLKEIFAHHQKHARAITSKMQSHTLPIIDLFRRYLKYGYYPYYLDFTDDPDHSLFYTTLEQSVRASLESDLPSIYPELSGTSIRKIRQLLSVIATSTPFSPDLSRLKRALDIGDERTLKSYLRYLEECGIILSLSRKEFGLKNLERPEKIFLNNPNLLYALNPGVLPNQGNLRETFFLSLVSVKHELCAAKEGDFRIDRRFTIEVGGKSKTTSQIKGMEDAYLAIDDIEVGGGSRIPLWLFGFLY
ncbi:MAG: ATP-binding protein [Deltaproteobacteria bacterium]|nr:ATP-binding protein [Deltaproteobacteria bacterium]